MIGRVVIPGRGDIVGQILLLGNPMREIVGVTISDAVAQIVG